MIINRGAQITSRYASALTGFAEKIALPARPLMRLPACSLRAAGSGSAGQ